MIRTLVVGISAVLLLQATTDLGIANWEWWLLAILLNVAGQALWEWLGLNGSR